MQSKEEIESSIENKYNKYYNDETYKLTAEEAEYILLEDKGFCKTVNYAAAKVLLNHIEQLEDNYNKGYIERDALAQQICKECKYKNKARELETKEQKLIEKLEEDIKKANEIIEDNDYRYIQEVIDEAYERFKYANEILKILKGENEK